MPERLAPVWERRHSGRYEYELKALAGVAGDSVQIDVDALTHGVLVVRFAWPVPSRQSRIQLEAVYPDSFPRIRPTVKLVASPEEYPPRHCSPIDGTLCLLGRESGQWRPSWTLRNLLENQLEDALNGTGVEDPQGEPPEFWWNLLGLNYSYFLVDSSWSSPPCRHGVLTLHGQFEWGKDRPLVRAVVTGILDATGKTLASWEATLPPMPSAKPAKTVKIPWYWSDKAVMATGEAAQIEELVHRAPAHTPHNLQSKVQLRCVAILFEAELEHDRNGLSFAFPALFGSAKQMQGRGSKGSPRPGIIPALRAGVEDMGARVPAVRDFRDKKVAMIGLGALGAPLAVELARNGCQALHLVDHDRVEPGNSIRWPLGVSAWGQHKSFALADFISREYPGTKPLPHHHHIGLLDNRDRSNGDDKLFSSILEEVDVVVDAAASHGVTGVLGDYCRDRKLPMVTLFATPNVEGGVVAQFGTDGACPHCLEVAWAAGKLTKPRGHGVEEHLRQPPGCAERTFTGASFDLQELSLQAMRAIVQIVGGSGAATQSFVHTLCLVDDTGPIPPSWECDRIPIQEDCECNTDR